MDKLTQLVQQIWAFVSERYLNTDEDIMAADDANGDGSLYYVGYCRPSTADTTAKWKIKKVEKTGNVYRIQYANGSKEYNSAWSNRASLTYI